MPVPPNKRKLSKNNRKLSKNKRRLSKNNRRLSKNKRRLSAKAGSAKRSHVDDFLDSLGPLDQIRLDKEVVSSSY